MHVEIWSDVVCPFCYIGKRKFERALSNFDRNAEVKVTWRSYQLRPDQESNTGKSVHQTLAESKGIPVEQAKQMGEHVTAMAKEEGLNFDFEKAIPANTFNAHRLQHLAAKHNQQQEAGEQLFKAYFEEGKNIADLEVLKKIGTGIGLPETEIDQLFSSDELAYAVKTDLQDAENLGIRGVPFFVLNRKYGISGAQPSEVLLQALEQAFAKEKTEN